MKLISYFLQKRKVIKYAVSRLLEKRVVDDHVEYKVQWEPLEGPNLPTWEPEENLLRDYPSLVEKFNRV